MKPARLGVQGGVWVELLLTIGPFLLLSLSVWQEAILCSGQVLTAHSAVGAARAASVVLTDDPKRYSGEAVNTASPRRLQAVRTAAVRAMSPMVYDETIEQVEVALPGVTSIKPGQELTVRVTATFRCKLPFARLVLCGADGTRPLMAEATLPAQAARYTYEK